MHHVVPVESRRSVLRLAGERAAKRVAHWQGVVASACEQCGRNQVPLVAPVEKLEHWLGRPSGKAVRLMLAPDGACSLAELPPASEVELLIGAEGGSIRRRWLLRARPVLCRYAWGRVSCGQKRPVWRQLPSCRPCGVI